MIIYKAIKNYIDKRVKYEIEKLNSFDTEGRPLPLSEESEVILKEATVRFIYEFSKLEDLV